MQVPATERRCARFGPFTVDLVSRELHNNGRKISLQDKPFQILAILLEQPGELVTREQFRQRLWPADTFVDFEHSINTAIKKLREALEDGGEEHQYIETLPKRGYRFIGTVEDSANGREGPAAPGESVAPAAKEQRQVRGRGRWYRYVLAVALVAALLVTALNLGGARELLWQRWRAARGYPGQVRSLAVLPLQNLSQDADQEYFADGLTDALITDLGQVAGLRVISRTSVMTYKKTSKPLPQIARELDVDAILEGTVLRSGDRLRVTVQLVRASPEEHLWAERYERDAGEVIPLEKRLALAIAHEVTGHLTTAEESALTSKRTTNRKAYDAYLRGRYLWNDRTEKAASGAGAYFEQALREDPNFALAYSGLADYYSVSWGPWTDLPRAESYARKAVALEPNLAEAHASLGIASEYQCNFAEAGRELQRATKLNPNYAMAHHWYAMHLLGMGRVKEALAENDRAHRLDLFSLPVNFFRSQILIAMHEYDQAIEQLETTAGINPPSRGNVHEMLSRIYWLQGRGPEAIAEEREEAKLATNSAPLPRDLDEVAGVYADSGLRAAQLEAAQLKQKACTDGSNDRAEPINPCNHFGIARQYGLLGEKEKALYWIRSGVAVPVHNRDQLLVIALKSAPEFDCLRSDPRFKELLRSLGLPE